MLGRGVYINLATVLLPLLLYFRLITSFQNETVKSNVTSVTVNDTELLLTTPRKDRKDNGSELERARTPAVEVTVQKLADVEKEKSDTGHTSKPGK